MIERRKGDRRREHGRLILVPLRPGGEGYPALPVARGIASVTDTPIHLILIDAEGDESSALAEEYGIGADEVEGMVIGRAAGPIETALLEEETRWEEPLIVLAYDRAIDRGGWIDPTAEKVLVECRGPILLVPDDWASNEWRLERILVPHDGTPTTSAAIGPAIDLAAEARAELIILHVAEVRRERPSEPGTLTVPRYIDQPQHEWEVWTTEFRDRLCARAVHRVEVRKIQVRHGEPAGEIERFAEEVEADLVVVGWRGQLDHQRARTMKGLIENSTAPLLLLKTE